MFDIDPNLINQYGLNFQNPTVQMMCGAQSPHNFSSVVQQFLPGGYGYNPPQKYYQQPLNL